MPETAIIIDWHGPFRSFAAARRSVSDNGWSHGLYAAIGHTKPYLFGDPHLQYIGESKNLVCRLDEETHSHLCKLSKVGLRIWIGIPASSLAAAVTSQGKHREILDAESVLIHFLPTRLNRAFVDKPPKNPVLVRNRWHWSERRRRGRPHRRWPDQIEYRPGESVYFTWDGWRPRVVRLKRLSRFKSEPVTPLLSRVLPRIYKPKAVFKNKWAGTRTICDISAPSELRGSQPLPNEYIGLPSE